MKKTTIAIVTILSLAGCQSKKDKLQEHYDDLTQRELWCLGESLRLDSIAKTHTNPDSIKYYSIQSKSAGDAAYDLMARSSAVYKRIEQLEDFGE